MTFGSLFTGIGGFDLGLGRAGMECAWQVEIDPKCREVLRRHWPDVPHHEDVTQVGGGDLGAVDLICGGFPCQDLSVAGRRAGLAGERSGLFYEFMRIVEEVAPPWVLIENVPGLLSSNGGRDMGTVLGVLGDLGYGYAWRILDSQYFGVPQRRRRVFIVGRAGGVCPPEVLFEPESLPGDSPPSRETGARTSVGSLLGPSGEGGGWRIGADEAAAGHVIAAQFDGHSANGLQINPEISNTLDGDGRAGIIQIARADASEDGSEREMPLVATAFNWQSGGDCRQNPQEELTDSLHVGQVPAVAFSVNQRREGRLREVHGSLAAPSGTQVDGVLAFRSSHDPSVSGEVSPTVSGGAGGGNTMPHTLDGTAIPRRLTPRECERLQAFPDHWTRYDSEGKEIADSPRYRMLGNAVTASVAVWVGERIMEVEAAE